MKQTGLEKFKNIFPYIAAGIICILLSIPAQSKGVVLDEAYSVVLARNSVAGIISGTAQDVHPPLYYLILKLASVFGGESLLKYRLVTVLPACLTLIWLGAGKIRRRFGWKTSVFFILWFGVNYCTLERSCILRMYSWGAFFVTASALFAFAFFEKGKWKDFIIAIVMTLAAMYTHYFAVMAVFALWLFLLAVTFVLKRKESWKIVCGGILIALGYLPWLGVLLRQTGRVSQDYWIKTFEWEEWFRAPATLMESSFRGIGAVLYFLTFVIVVIAVLRKKWTAVCCFGIFAATALIGALLSITVTPIWQTRYLYVAWGMLSLGIAITVGGAEKEQTKKNGCRSLFSQGALAVIMCVTGFYAVQTMYRSEVMTSTADEWVVFLEENISKEDCMILDDPGEHGLVFRYYLPQNRIVMTESLETMGGNLKLSDVLEETGKGRIWYIVDYVQQRLGVERMQAALEEVGYEMHSTASFTIPQKSLEIFEVRYGDL